MGQTSCILLGLKNIYIFRHVYSIGHMPDMTKCILSVKRSCNFPFSLMTISSAFEKPRDQPGYKVQFSGIKIISPFHSKEHFVS